MSSLNKLVPCVCSSIEVVAEGTVELGTSSIVINREGRVAGFKACLSQGIHLSLQQLLSSAWHVQCNEGLLANPIDGDTHSLQDILRFVLTFAATRDDTDSVQLVSGSVRSVSGAQRTSTPVSWVRGGRVWGALRRTSRP